MSSFPLASFLITLLLAAAVCTHGGEPVIDTNGNEVRIREQYIIQPINTGHNGGGLVPLAATEVSLCPLTITEALPGKPGMPVSLAFPPFFLTDRKVVNTSFDITIEFKYNVCNEPSRFWKVDEFPPNPTEPGILIGGRPKEPNCWFKIEKVGNYGTNIYKLTTSAGTVGAITLYGGRPELVLTNDRAKILLVKFIKVNDATTDVTSTSRVEKLGLRMVPFY